MLKTLIMKAALIAFVGSASFAAHAIADTQRFDVPAGDLIAALESFAKQADVDIVYQDEQVKGLQTLGVSGDFSPRDAVMKLLEGTPLRLQTDEASGALLITTPLPSGGPASSTLATDENQPKPTAGADSAAVREKRSFWNRFRLAQAEASPSAQGERSERDNSPSVSAEDAMNRIVLEEIVVTGTHLRGVETLASPIIEIDREEIERSGVGTLEQILEKVPQMTGGTRTSFATSLAGGDGANFSAGTGVNLRGLGEGATLILVNGRRLAPSGIGNFIDMSIIPLDTVDRIEILPDGASAIYGSDAVGGVINIILRKDYEGVGLRLRYGRVTQGGFDEPQATITAGRRWSSGSAMLSYNILDRSELDSADRDFTRTALDPTWLNGEQRRHGGLARLSQKWGDGTTLFADAIYSRNTEDGKVTTPFGAGTRTLGQAYESEQYGGTFGARVEISESWGGELSTSYSENRAQFANIINGAPGLPFDSVAKVWSTDAKADGAVGRIAGGDVKLAVGAQFRQESYDSSGTRLPTLGELNRDVYALFGELLVPFVGTDNAIAGVKRLELSVAGRYEHYSDFGSSTDPKVGLLWSVLDGLNLRGTFGRSFRAPLLNELNDAAFRSGLAAITFVVPDPLFPAGTPSIYISDGNPDLGSETSESWTLGADLRLPNWSVSLTYFNIDHEDRIAAPVVGGLFGAFVNEAANPTVTRNPTAAQVAALWPFVNTSPTPGITQADIRAIVDDRLINIASRREDGIDVDTSYERDTDTGRFVARLSGTYLFRIEDQITPAAAVADVLNTVYRPVDLRLRSGLEWSRNAFSASAFVNYVDDYQDNRATSPGDINSWTTVDVSFLYRFSETSDHPTFQGFGVALSVQNLFDRDPPFVANTSRVFFDSTNASPLGRFVAIELQKNW